MASALGNPILEPSALRCENLARESGPRAALPAVQFSKIDDYLADNIHVQILSRMTDGFKKKMDGLSAQFQNGNVAV